MDSEDKNIERFRALVEKYKVTISQVAKCFYAPGSYLFHELECDLITYLWRVYRDRPDNIVVFWERRWVHKLLYRHALNVLRDESHYQGRYVYGADLSELVDTSTDDPLVNRLYRLIAKLDADDQDLIMRYIAKEPLMLIAEERGKSVVTVYRQIARIRDELCRLNAEIDDDDDDDRLLDVTLKKEKEYEETREEE